KGPQGPVLKTSSITMPPLPTAVGVDPSLGRIYCVTFDFYNGSNYLTSVDGSTGAILGSQATGAPGPIAVNSRTHTIYLVRRTEVYVPNPGYSIPLGAGSDAHGVAVDETTGSVYVAEYGTDSVAVIDTQPQTYAAGIPSVSHPTAVAGDTSPRRLLKDP